jgi:curved DNA-binding protein CbpA
MESLSPYFEILELEPGATQEQIRQSYRDLVSIWHPDRFEHNQRLKEKAAEKLKLINDARDKLKNYQPPATSGKVKERATPSSSSDSGFAQPTPTTADIKQSPSIVASPLVKYGGGFLALMGLLIIVSVGFIAYKEGSIKVVYNSLGGLIPGLLMFFGYIFVMKNARNKTKTVSAEEIAEQQRKRDEAHSQVIECMIIMAMADGQMDEAERNIIIDLVKTLGIDASKASQLIQRAGANIGKNAANARLMLQTNAEKLSKYFDRKTKLQIISLFEMLIKADGSVMNTERVLYADFKKAFKAQSILSKVASALSDKCPNCNSTRVTLTDEKEVDRWKGTKQVTEKLASGKLKTRTVQTTFVKIQKSYRCDECVHAWDEYVKREK